MFLSTGPGPRLIDWNTAEMPSVLNCGGQTMSDPMSYYTRVDVVRDDEHDAPTGAVLQAALAYVRNKGWHEDVVADLRASLEGADGALFNKLGCEEFEGLMLLVSRAFPTVWFGARGMGEEFRDLWIREFRGGEVIFAQGPFAED